MMSRPGPRARARLDADRANPAPPKTRLVARVEQRPDDGRTYTIVLPPGNEYVGEGGERIALVEGGQHELLTVTEAAALLRVTPKALQHMIDRAQLPGVVRLGRRVRIRAEDLRRHVGLLQPPPPSGSANR